MAEHKHWRELVGKNYLVAQVFEKGTDRVYTIKDVQVETLENTMKDTTDTKVVLSFEEDDFKLALNRTNEEQIEKLFGTGFVDEWIGKKIQLFTTNVKAFGGLTPCIRVRDFLPKSDAVEYHCSVCGKLITEEIYKGSVERYGKAYCSKECLDKDIKGENINDILGDK